MINYVKKLSQKGKMKFLLVFIPYCVIDGIYTIAEAVSTACDNLGYWLRMFVEND